MKAQSVVGLVLTCLTVASAAQAEEDLKPVVVFDRERGESSPGTSAPSRQQMLNAIKSSTPTRLYATLEYGERVECFECIPVLTNKILTSDNAEVREIGAWWLRRRSFGFGQVMTKMQDVARRDTDPVRRARAAGALGEFLDVHALPVLSDLVASDTDTTVRVEAVRAVGRLNVMQGHAALSGAMRDPDAHVRLAALEQVLKVNSFQDAESLLGLVGDADTRVRSTAVQLVGELRLTAATDALLGVLITDDSAQVRQAAAIALGRIGGVDASSALADARSVEKDESVQSAIAIAMKMR